MAAVVGVVGEVWGMGPVKGPTPTHTITVEQEVECCFVNVTWPAGTYASGDDANFVPGDDIAAATHEGKTCTVLQACFVSPGDENGSLVGADACSVSSGTVTCQLLQEDLSTEHGDGAMSATWNRPITFCVTYVKPVEG